MTLNFREVDVFCSHGFDGNPLGVVHNADQLSDSQMQTIANWTNFSETTFLVQPSVATADYRVRIFTPFEELPFAGHPTLGSAHAWLEAGGTPSQTSKVVQECGIGLVTLRQDGGRLRFEAPPLIRSGPPDESVRLRTLAVMGLDDSEVANVEWIDNGPRWIGVELVDLARIGSLTPSPVDDDEVDIAVFSIGSGLEGVDVELRCFFGPDVREDPVTGSANASVAVYLQTHDKVRFPYVAAQGNYMGRNGRAYVSAESDGSLWVGGDVRTVVVGHIDV
ncbi:MAG: PhzF family phenazine biosynthesis protein [Acidimicrobiales bacterium]